jgi:hypothetical protein
MKIFICNRSIDAFESENIISKLLSISENSIAVIQEKEHSENWKEIVEKKFQEVDFILFMIGQDTFSSHQIIWELAKAKQLYKQIVALKLQNASTESVLYCEGFQVFETTEQCLKYLTKKFEDSRQLRIEQYKIMVSSTEKVSEQRLTVNNLFFTVTSSVLSVAFILGKTLDFRISGILGMITLTALGLTITFFWEKLVKSYGKLNTGKFKLIDRIEKDLRTNMFEEEWKILTHDIKYEPNTKTECKVIIAFRIFIFIALIIEILLLQIKILNLIF